MVSILHTCFYFIIIFVNVCVRMHVGTGTTEAKRKGFGKGALRWNYRWVLGSEPQSSDKSVSVLNHRA